MHSSHNRHGDFYIGPSSTPVFGREQYNGILGDNLKESISLIFNFSKKIIFNENKLRTLALQELSLLTKRGFFNQIKKASPVTVYAESTPNPNAMKFVVNKRIVNDIFEFKSIEETNDSPFAKSLFGFPFVKEVFFDFNFVSIIQNSEHDWQENVMDVREFIRSFIQDKDTIVFEENIKKLKPEKQNIEYDDVPKEIIKIIDENIKPAVASDGGNILFESYEKDTKKVNVILQGACSGCPSSTITLKSGIETMLKDMLPGMISEVNAING